MNELTALLRITLALLAFLSVESVQGQTGRRIADTTRLKDDTLKTVTITGRKQPFERRADRVVVHVEAMMAATGGTAWDVLERSPGIQAGNEQLSLNGRTSLNVYIDGKPTYLQGEDLANYLKALPAGLLATIEILSNPPAQYDAAGNGGIILITLRKSRAKGLNGNLLSENIQGRYARILQSANINLRHNKVNLFANLNNYNGSGVSDITQVREFAPAPGRTLSHVEQQGRSRPFNDRFFIKGGIEYQATPQTDLVLSASITRLQAIDKRHFEGRQSFDDPGMSDTLLNTTNTIGRSTRDHNLTFCLQHRFDSTGRQFSAMADYTRYNEGYNTQLLTTGTAGGMQGYTEQRNVQQPYTVNIYAVKADYEQPAGKGNRWNAGIRSSYTTALNTVTGTITGNGSQLLSSRLHYEEWVHAGYASYQGGWERWSWQWGLRAEHTTMKGSETAGASPAKDTGFRKTYMNLFPSVFLQYKADATGRHQLSFSYSRRIDRPRYTYLRPLATPVDRFNYTMGNPYLLPQFTDNIEVAWTLNNRMTVTIFGSTLHNGIAETIVAKGPSLYRQPANLGRRQTAGLSFDATIALTAWYTITPAFQYTFSYFAAQLNETPVRLRGGNWHAAASQQFSLQRGWNVELTPDYNSREVNFQYEQAATWYIHAGISKRFLRDKGAIKVFFRDLFLSRRDDQYFNQVQGVTGYNTRGYDTRSITLAFSYRFNKGAKAGQSLRSNSEERNRLGE